MGATQGVCVCTCHTVCVCVCVCVCLLGEGCQCLILGEGGAVVARIMQMTFRLQCNNIIWLLLLRFWACIHVDTEIEAYSSVSMCR